MFTFRHMFIIGLISFLPATAKEQVVSSTEFSFPNTRPGIKLTVDKVLDEETGKIKAKSNGQEISVDSIEKMRLEEDAFLDRKHGAVKGGLRNVMEKIKDDEMVEVTVSLRPPRVDHLDKTKHTVEECKAHSKKLAAMKPDITTGQAIERTGVQIRKIAMEFDDKNDQRVHSKMTKKEILKLSFLPEIGSISLHEKPVPCDVPAPLSSFASSAWNPSPHPFSLMGQGVKAAVFEYGIMENFWDGVVGAYINHFSSRGNLNPSQVATVSSPDPNVSSVWHTQIVFSCLWYTAPAASFHHQIGTYYGMAYDEGHSPYIINNGIQTSSISTTRSPDPDDLQMLFMDDFAYSWPWPVFCNPASNVGVEFGYGGDTVNWGCYNALSVGSSQHQNSNHYTHAGHSRWVNPKAQYGSTRDREMPYVLAPGQWPYLAYNPDCGWDPYAPGEPVGFDYESALKKPFSHGAQGTSFAAPTANGVAATVISSDISFASWPEKVRLAMILTAQNCDGGEWNSTFDDKDGAGTISAQEAEFFARNHTSISQDNPAVESGLCATSWWVNETGMKTFNTKIPTNRPVGKHLRVVLLWDSRPYLPAAKNYLTDLDLSCVRGSTVLKNSVSYNSNIEIVDIPRSSLVAGETIQAKINPFTFRFDPNETYKFFYYAIGWTWVKDQAQ